MSLIFIAVPTRGVATNGKLNESFIRDVAFLHKKFPEHAFIVPMIQDYAVLAHLDTEATWDIWGPKCRAIIPRCDEVWVMMYNGWDESVGVTGEYNHAVQNKIIVQFIQPWGFK